MQTDLESTPEPRIKPAKPLGAKGYGSTPHLVGSRVGPSDSHVEPTLAKIMTEKVRNRHDRIIVTEKLDGSCLTAANVGGRILPVNRAGYLVSDSPWPMQHVFGRYVEDRGRKFASVLSDGERIAGEWMLQAHGTRYRIVDPDDLFVAFSIIGPRGRIPYDEFAARVDAAGIRRAHVISDGPAMSQAQAVDALGSTGFHDALEQPEGAVWVLETRGEFNCIAKHVIPEKIDGKYLSSITGVPEIWNYEGDDYRVAA
ncbi:RNA ligase family protein [Rhizobium leguminosarum]|uniref:RNA ligase family protein n=1 Tax=Rhizobium leguminosarum TaxID=384 RepID=UPI002E0E14A7|nr:hypothetical protein U8Q02_43010 [Rhizobium leguminosarum]